MGNKYVNGKRRNPLVWYLELNKYHIGEPSGKNNFWANIIDLVLSLTYFVLSMIRLWSGYKLFSANNTQPPSNIQEINMLFAITVILIARVICRNFKKMQNFSAELPENYRKAISYSMLSNQNSLYIGILLISGIYFIAQGFSFVGLDAYVMSSTVSFVFLFVELTDVLVDSYKCAPAINKLQLG